MYNNSDGKSWSPGRKYQGYPYVNPIVIEVPSIDAASAAKWNNLPRRPVKPAPEKKEESPVVYIDIPSGSSLTSSVSQPNISSPVNEESEQLKVDPDENPVVYIDLPERNGSDVANRRQVDESEDSFVEETIFYDPFKDRRITSDRESSHIMDAGGGPSSYRRSPPNTLNLGSLNAGYTHNSLNSNIPQSLSKEVSVYHPIRSPEDLYPEENRDFPEPPPAYTVHDTTVPNGSFNGSGIPGSPAGLNSENETQTADEPRTQVITTESIKNRKLLYCAFCGLRSHALTIRQAGFATHLIAILFLLCGLFPVTIFIYCTDFCKYNNYYCKNCNAKIAYEIPMLCQELNYATN